MAELPASTVHLWLAEPPGTDRELFEMLAQLLGTPLPGESRVLALGALRERLLQLHAAGGQCLVVVDESHKISDAGLEAIRLLNNLEQGAAKLIQVLLLGQKELTELLAAPGHEAFRQRIANFELLGCMRPLQVRDYVRHRLRVAGGEPGIFPEPLLDAVAEAAAGTPRLTNSLCDRALRNAFEAGRQVVDAKDLLQAAEEVGVYRKAFHFLLAREPAAGQPPPAAPVAPEPRPQAAGEPAAAPAAPPEPQPAPVPVPSFAAPAPAAGPADAAPRPARERPPAGPLLLLAGGIAALAASLLYYRIRATASYGGDWVGHLVADLLR
jgi:general secretion pathway protein A